MSEREETLLWSQRLQEIGPPLWKQERPILTGSKKPKPHWLTKGNGASQHLPSSDTVVSSSHETDWCTCAGVEGSGPKQTNSCDCFRGRSPSFVTQIYGFAVVDSRGLELVYFDGMFVVF